MAVASSGEHTSAWSRFRAWVPLVVLVGVALQTIFFLVFWATDRLDAAPRREAARIVLTYATVIALFFGVHLAFASRRRARRIALGALVFVFTTLNAGRTMSDGPIDYGFAFEHVVELATPLGRHILGTKLGYGTLAILVFAPIAAVALLRFVPSLPWPGPRRVRWGLVGVCFVVVFLPPKLHVSTHEAVSSFAASAFRFHAQTRAADAVLGPDPYPLVHEQTPTAAALKLSPDPERPPRPHVILVFLESWNGWFTQLPRANGKPYTPIIARHAERGAMGYVPFYGNSMQSSRGHFATLCSLSSSVRGKEFVDYHERRLHCLPQVMREAGYRTFFLSATAQATFERGQEWFLRTGFDTADFQSADPKTRDATFWGTGLQDDVFYRQLFQRVDDELAKEPKKPLFVTAANASNHYPFDEAPDFVPDADETTKHRRAYAASLAKADAWLETFFVELAKRPALSDAIVVLVGDHGFPADEHGVHINMLGANDETFRTSFFLRWGERELPRREGRAFSQIDIAPTIADLLLLRGKTHFSGQSVLDDAKPSPVPLVQPYDGIHLAVVLWPWKLVRHEASDQEHLYDLRADPQETIDHIKDPAAASVLPTLRAGIMKIRATHALLREDRVWPSGHGR